MKRTALMIGMGLLLGGQEAPCDPEWPVEIPASSDLESQEVAERLARAEAIRRQAGEINRLEEENHTKTMGFFQAMAGTDTRAVCLMLNAGFDPDAELPWPVPQEFARQFEDRLIKYPASHGCIRLPSEMAKALFDLAPEGTLVEIIDSSPSLADTDS
ncbi:MAG: L,D-transpeptidase [Terrimicrobiaceae bacterium]